MDKEGLINSYKSHERYFTALKDSILNHCKRIEKILDEKSVDDEFCVALQNLVSEEIDGFNRLKRNLDSAYLLCNEDYAQLKSAGYLISDLFSKNINTINEEHVALSFQIFSYQTRLINLNNALKKYIKENKLETANQNSSKCF